MTGDDPLIDDADVVSTTLPNALACGEALAVTITLENSGTSTWSRSAGVELGAVDESDPLSSGVRIALPVDLEVGPGDSYDFQLDLEGPDTEAAYLTDWQMVRTDPQELDSPQWFGELAQAEVEVSCPEDPAPDLDAVIWLHTDVSGWEETMTLESVTIDGGTICVNHSDQDEGVFVWEAKEYSPDVWVVGNPWIFIEHEGQWYAATWEWLRPDQTCKAVTSVAASHIKVKPFDPQSNWAPTSGETYYFMVSALARQTNAVKNVSERSNLVPFVWP